MSQPERRREVSALDHAAGLAQQALADGPDQVTAVLERLQGADRIFYLGAGPAYGTALFGAAKILEEVPLCGIPQHLEAWAHLQYFLTAEEGERTRVVIVAPRGDSVDRAAEIAESIREEGGVAVAVTHAAETEMRAAASAVVVVDGECWEGYAPLPYAVPVQLLGVALALRRGRTVIPLGRRDGGRLIRASAVRTPAR
jgi:glucosamine--fructose-6-phosphate aminotransferase (isomerizing)